MLGEDGAEVSKAAAQQHEHVFRVAIVEYLRPDQVQHPAVYLLNDVELGRVGGLYPAGQRLRAPLELLGVGYFAGLAEAGRKLLA
ncbi:hypothetical protein GCM10022406_25480 [Hymenobacter algoricola]|uniref:Uncharacterized protein n=1 Tax=Hymenobacter algoricola TaxID=486267 RepID=A0ABP7N922_9BACT